MKVALVLSQHDQTTSTEGMNISCHEAMVIFIQVSLFKKKLGNSHPACIKQSETGNNLTWCKCAVQVGGAGSNLGA
jgi:hypothetical protein